MELEDITLKYVDGENKDFVMLCDKLDQALDDMVGTHVQRAEYVQYNQRDSIHDVVVAYDKDTPIGCASFKKHDDEHAELKRVFTDPAYRGIGLGNYIVTHVEKLAKQKGFRYCILETGAPLKAAQHLYTKLGYKVIPNYGQYANMTSSICMKKSLA